MKRDLYICKETSTHEKRRVHMKRDLYICKKTYTHEKRPALTMNIPLILSILWGEILNSQLATQFAVYTDYEADF